MQCDLCKRASRARLCDVCADGVRRTLAAHARMTKTEPCIAQLRLERWKAEVAAEEARKAAAQPIPETK